MQIVDNNGRLTTSITQMISDSEKKISLSILDNHTQTRTAIVQSEHNLSTQLQQIQLQQVQLHDTTSHQVAGLLSSLHFSSINRRHNDVQQRVGKYDTTYKWIFDRGQPFGFVEWLASDEALFWISGKPGSGKSPLINYKFKIWGQKGPAGHPYPNGLLLRLYRF